MPRGNKSKYTDKQKRKAEHIEDGHGGRGVAKEQARRRAWAAVNEKPGGGNKSGSARGKANMQVFSRKGGKDGEAVPA